MCYSSRDQTVSVACVTTLLVEGNFSHVLCEPETLMTWELSHRATNCNR
jgi:hypothetical protein